MKSGQDYNQASLRLIEIFHAAPNAPEGDELELLMALVKDYDDKNYQLPELDPLDVIKSKMQDMGIRAKDLESIIGSKGHVSAILSSKRDITLKMARKLKDFFSLPADIFLQGA